VIGQLEAAVEMCGALIVQQQAAEETMGTAWVALEAELAAEEASIDAAFNAAPEVASLAKFNEKLETLTAQAKSDTAGRARAQLACRLAQLESGASSIDELGVVFATIDADGSGEIDLDEFKQAIGRSGFACGIDQTDCIDDDEVQRPRRPRRVQTRTTLLQSPLIPSHPISSHLIPSHPVSSPLTPSYPV
jgi:hypothetical protein